MAKTTKVILLERIDPHGKMGDVVNVRPGFARNYLLPQRKALRATSENIAYFETRKKDLEAQNEAKRKDAAKIADKLKTLSVVLIRQAGDKGQLYGSVSSRDISAALADQNVNIERSMVNLNTAMKEIGLFEVEIILHPEVRINVEINIARNEEEASVQKRTGQAIIAGEGETADLVMARAENELEELLEKEAYKAEKEKLAEEQEKDLEIAEKEAAAREKAKSHADAKAREAKEAAKNATEDDGSEVREETEDNEKTADK